MDIELEVKNIEFKYKHNNILENLSFNMKTPDILCILGSNGIGKSTLLKCLTGLEKISSGEIYYNKKNLSEFSRKDLAKMIAYVPQNSNIISSFTVLERVLMGRISHIKYFSMPGKEDVHAALENLEFLGIFHLKDREYSNLSGGEQQLVRIASALSQNPKLILFDEPTSYLDFGNQYRFLKILKSLSARGIGSIMTTHFPNYAGEIADIVAVMKNKKIFHIGKPEKIITKEIIEDIYNIKVDIIANKEKRIVIF